MNVVTHPLPYRFIIFDCDNTLRRCTVPGQPCPNRRGEWQLLPNTLETLQRYPDSMFFGMASNQGGVALGFLDVNEAWNLLMDCWNALGIVLQRTSTMLCPHHPQAGCACRKPLPGMLCVLMDRADMLAKDTLYVGDQPSDEDAARRAGIDFVWSHEFFGWDYIPVQYIPVL